jgi:hypothetical protein
MYVAEPDDNSALFFARDLLHEVFARHMRVRRVCRQQIRRQRLDQLEELRASQYNYFLLIQAQCTLNDEHGAAATAVPVTALQPRNSSATFP